MKGGSVDLCFHIRPFSRLEEYQACAEFQDEIWGKGFREGVSPAILMVANKIGGLSAGVYGPGDELLGFVFGLTGIKDGELVHWSDMLAVREGYRDRGLGTALKAYQREILLQRGIRRMHWTFDPLQSRNAYVNFSRLGIISTEYVRDMYGDTGSPLHQGVGTDRLVATWEMDSDRVMRRISGAGGAPPQEETAPHALPVLDDGPLPRPGEPRLELSAPAIFLAVPRDVDAVMAEDPGLARQWRLATRSVFEGYMERGYAVREIFPRRSVSHYLLVRERAVELVPAEEPAGRERVPEEEPVDKERAQ